MHSYCIVCQKQVPYELVRDHGCKFGFGRGMIHPEMNPKYLVNEVFWSEPELPQSDESEESEEEGSEDPAARDIREIRQIMKRHAAGRPRILTSQTIRNNQLEFRSFGRRFQA